MMERIRAMRHLYERDRNDQVIPVKGSQFIGHAEDGASSPLQWRFFYQAENLCQLISRCRRLFYFDRVKLAVTFQNQVNFMGVLIPVIIQKWFMTHIMIAFHNQF